eukprot:a679392_59.p1 GENE.a679392_59~~a679392_59.p1  ORF type:complete len:154 (+),score=50.17 a679392_59:40-462(+)
MQGSRVLSSFVLEGFLTLNRLWTPIWFLLTLALVIYKAVSFPFVRASLGFEITFMCVLVIIDLVRTKLGSQGNLTESVAPLFLFLLLSLSTIFGCIFFLRLQTYVLAIDEVINVIGLVLQCTEFLLALIATFVIHKGQSV